MPLLRALLFAALILPLAACDSSSDGDDGGGDQEDLRAGLYVATFSEGGIDYEVVLELPVLGNDEFDIGNDSEVTATAGGSSDTRGIFGNGDAFSNRLSIQRYDTAVIDNGQVTVNSSSERYRGNMIIASNGNSFVFDGGPTDLTFTRR